MLSVVWYGTSDKPSAGSLPHIVTGPWWRDVFVQERSRAVPYASSVRQGIEPLLSFLAPLAPDAVV